MGEHKIGAKSESSLGPKNKNMKWNSRKLEIGLGVWVEHIANVPQGGRVLQQRQPQVLALGE